MAGAPSGGLKVAQAEGQSSFHVSIPGLLTYARDRVAAALAFPKSGLVRRDFRLAGLDMTVWFTSEALAELCDGKLIQHSPETSFSHVAQIYAIDAKADGWEFPAVWPEGAGFSSREFDRTLADGNMRGFYHHDAPSWQFFDPAAGVGVHTMPEPLAIPPWEEGSPLRLFIHWAYAAAGMRLTHAATLGQNGIGALIAGASGSGKSGTTLAGLLNGLNSAGDDYVVVEQGEKVVARSVFRVFKQDREGLARSGLTQGDIGETRLNWHGKVEFDAARLVPDRFVDQMEIRALLLPRIAHADRTWIEEVSAQEAALMLAPSSVLQLPGDAASGFGFLSALVKRLPAFRVNLSEHPAEIAGAIGSFLLRQEGYAN